MTILADPITTPVEVTTPMKPSEALRLGAMTTEQAFHVSQDGKGGMCAVGTITHVGMGSAVALFTSSSQQRTCPACRSWVPLPAITPNVGLVVHLNDDHRWPRERIADWLESIGL